MRDSKKWYESKGVWGGTIAAISGLVSIFDVDTAQTIGSLTPAIQELIVQASGLIGGILAIYGRIKADKEIGK